MRLALVTTPPSVRSGIGDYTRHLLEHLKGLAAVRVFVEHGLEGESLCGIATESVLDLRPRAHDQVLFQIGNEIGHAFMVPLLRAIGGAVCLHDWVLFDLAVAASPELARGGLRGHLAALRAGGPGQLAIYRANGRERRRARVAPGPSKVEELSDAVLVSGWHAPERAREQGRWTADRAVLRVPAERCRRVRMKVSAEPGRSLLVQAARGPARQLDFADATGGELDLSLEDLARPSIVLETSGLSITREQRARGDARRLGCFVREVRYEDERGWHALDLGAAAGGTGRPLDLSSARFDLPLNRGVVRWADAFIVHSELVGANILAERNAPTPVAVLPHGTERRWREGDRRAGRTALGLPADWRESFLLVSFGAVQAHKRIDVLLEGFALALEDRPDLRLALVGHVDPEEYDVRALIARHGLEHAVHLSGYVEEELGWDFLHAADLAVQLRGPSTGGSSGGVHQALSLGRAVVVSDLGEQNELPDACVRKLAPGPGEVGRLADLLTELRDDPRERARMEREVRRHVEEVANFERAAAGYIDALERFPRPRGNKKHMFAQRVRKAALASRQGSSGS